MEPSRFWSMESFFSMQGRVSRSTYWGMVGVQCVFAVACIVIMVLALVARFERGSPNRFMEDYEIEILWLGYLIAFIVCCFGFCITVKRLHDVGIRGWVAAIQFVPYVGPLVILILCGVVPGSSIDNRFGPPPGAPAAPDISVFK